MEINKSYPCRETNYKKGRTGAVNYIVIHYVGALGSARENAVYYGRDKVEASAHYFVDHGPKAEVYASVPEGDTAWHCGAKTYRHPECRNGNSIGIEMCCWKDPAGRWYFDGETVERTVELTRALMAKYGIDAGHVLRHYDVTGKCCPAPFVVDEGAWERFQACLTAPREEEAAGVSAWAEKSWEKAVDRGVFDGTRPGGALTREQAAVVLDRLGLLN